MSAVLPSRRSRPHAGRATSAAAFVCLLVLALGPVLLVDIPAMVDYPNHLARMSVLSRDGGAAANPFYEVVWALYPNLAMDLLVPPLARVVGVEAATRGFYLASQILVVGGSIAIEFAVKRRFHIAGLVAILFLYSIPFAWGFVNFQFGLGLALCSVAGWIALKDRHAALRFAFHAAVVMVLFVSHLFALGIYGVTIGICELWRVRSGEATRRSLPPTAAALAAPVAVLLGAMTALGGSVGGAGNVWGAQHKLEWLFLALNGYSVALSAFSTGILAFLAYVLARRGALRLEGAGAWLAPGFALLFLAMPLRLFDTAFVDVRIVVAAVLILPAFVSVRIPEPAWRTGAASCVAGLVVVNLGYVAVVQMFYRAEYAAVVASFGQVESGSRLLVGHSGEAEDPPRDRFDYPMHHAPVLAVHYADAFVPTLFTYPGKQPVLARPAYRHLDVPQGGPAPLEVLRAAVDGGAGVPSYVANWPVDFDYLYLVGKPAVNPMPDRLDELAGGSRFSLYRIRKPGR